MGEKRGTKALQVWCKRITDGYKDVNVENMSSSWRDGLAFCALIHHFHPELIDFESLSKENVLENNQLAFSVAEKHLGIPALLDAEDMVKYKVPDKLSIMTYVSQFYQCFRSYDRTISPKKRAVDNGDTSTTPSPASPDSPPSKSSTPLSSSPRRYDVCQSCRQRVYILERLIIDNKLYHRTCFKCSRCKLMLKPGSYAEGNEPGLYECVSCPDEEEAEKAAVASMAANRIARLTSPTESWQLPKFKQFRPSEQRDLKLASSVAEARMVFLNDSMCSRANEKTYESVKSAKSDETDGKMEKPIDLPVLSSFPGLAPMAKPEEADSTPIPSPRPRRRASLTTDVDERKQKENDDVFLTPSASPVPSLRRAKPTHDVAADLTPKTKPIASVRQSKSMEMRTDVSLPSRTGVVMTDLPVIRSSIDLSPRSTRSPAKSRTTEDVTSGGEGSPRPPPKPKRLSASTEAGGDVPPMPTKRAGRSKLEETNKTIEKDEKEEPESINVTPKKVPPPRPELPAFLRTLPRLSTANLTAEIKYPDGLNPFDDDDENASFESCEDKKSLNPFDSDEDVVSEITKVETSKSEEREAPPGSNPFGSDDEEDESVKDEKPTPLPRQNIDSKSTDVSPAGSIGKNFGLVYRGSCSADTSPASSIGKASGLKYSPFRSPSSSDISGRRTSRDSGLDLSPTGSLNRGYRKKRQAPLPPGPPFVSSPGRSHGPSPRTVKKSPAPPPPPMISARGMATPSSDNEIDEKAIKEMDNLTLKSSGSDPSGNECLSSPSPGETAKTTFGYWKKKKPAPPVPLPPKRQITKLPMEEILKELKNIEEKQLEMEKRGVELEKAIREENLQENDTVDGEESELVLQLFELVNEKNAMFRRQTELVYLRRQQRLEEEHAELEYQIRCLMGKPETIKSGQDRELEEELIQRLMEVVRQRSEIIDSMDSDRLREAVEDKSIRSQMTLRQASSSSRPLLSSSWSNLLDSRVKKEKKKKKEKLKKAKGKEKNKCVDEDKDLDETEAEIDEKSKKEKKRKWF